MTENIFLLAFLTFFAAELLITWTLDILNKKSILQNPEVPEFFKDKIDRETYKKGQAYSLAKIKFTRWDTLYSACVTLIVLFSGFLLFLQSLLDELKIGNTLRGVLFFFILTFLLGTLRFPFGLWETFKIETVFGFNKTTLKLYLTDTLKTIALSIIIGVPVLYAVLKLLNRHSPLWWIRIFAILVFFQLFMLFVYPVFIAPLFNKFKPLEEGELRNSLLALADKIKFPARDIYVMDGSRRSAHSNAYFTGFGRMRRIVLYDTLIAQMSIPELVAVLCHEIGHFKKGHIYRKLVMSFFIQGALLFILSFFIDWKPMYTAFGFEGNVENLYHVGLFLFSVTASTFMFVTAPLMNYHSRKQEFEADAFAAHNTKNPAAMESALVNLAEKNLANLTPHPWYSFFHYSHPTIYERITAIRKSA